MCCSIATDYDNGLTPSPPHFLLSSLAILEQKRNTQMRKLSCGGRFLLLFSQSKSVKGSKSSPSQVQSSPDQAMSKSRLLPELASTLVRSHAPPAFPFLSLYSSPLSLYLICSNGHINSVRSSAFDFKFWCHFLPVLIV